MPQSTKQRESRGGSSPLRGAKGRQRGRLPLPTTDAAPALPLLRTSERGSLKACEWRWQVEFVHRRKPQIAAPALRFGSLVHIALAGWYVKGRKRGVHPVKGFNAAYEADMAYFKQNFGAKVVRDIEGDEKWVNAKELGPAILENYIDQYDRDSNWEVLTTEQPFRVLVYKPDTEGHHYLQPEPWFWYVGIVDGVWRDLTSNEIWIPDHKTTAGIGGTEKFPVIPPHLRIDDQAGAYWSWGVDWLRMKGLLKVDRPLAGMLYNFIAKKLPDERPSKYVGGTRVYLNKDGSVSKKQPTPHFARIRIHRDEYDREEQKRRSLVDFGRKEMLQEGTLAITKSPGQMTCGMCWARDICELHETGNDWLNFMRETTVVWDPYEEHAIYEGDTQ